MMEEIVPALIAIYLAMIALTFVMFCVGIILNYLQSGQDLARGSQVFVAALLWPRTWWLLTRIPKYMSLAEWQRSERFRRRRFREKEARALVGQGVKVIREISTDVGRNENLHIPVGATGRIKGVEGTRKKRFVLDIEWDEKCYQGCPYDLGVGFYGWDKRFFQEGYLAITS